MSRPTRFAATALFCVMATCFGVVATVATYRYAQAQADVAAPAVDGPSTVTVTVAPDADSAAMDMFQSAPLVLIPVLILFGVSRGILWLDARRPTNTLARMRPWLVMTTSVLGGAIVSLSAASTINLRVMIGAIVAALILELRANPRPKSPPETKPDPLPEARVVS